MTSIVPMCLLELLEYQTCMMRLENLPENWPPVSEIRMCKVRDKGDEIKKEQNRDNKIRDPM